MIDRGGGLVEYRFAERYISILAEREPTLRSGFLLFFLLLLPAKSVVDHCLQSCRGEMAEEVSRFGWQVREVIVSRPELPADSPPVDGLTGLGVVFSLRAGEFVIKALAPGGTAEKSNEVRDTFQLFGVVL